MSKELEFRYKILGTYNSNLYNITKGEEDKLIDVYLTGMLDVLNKIMYKIPKIPKNAWDDGEPDDFATWRLICAEASDHPWLPGYFFYDDENGIIAFKKHK